MAESSYGLCNVHAQMQWGKGMLGYKVGDLVYLNTAPGDQLTVVQSSQGSCRVRPLRCQLLSSGSVDTFVQSELLSPVGTWYKICVLLSAHRIPSSPNSAHPEMDAVRRVLPQDIYYNASAYAADEAQLHQLLKTEKQRLADQLFELMATADGPERDRGVHVALRGEYHRQLE